MKIFTIVLFFAMVLIANGIKGQTTDGLVGYWPMDEMEGDMVADQSGNWNDGVLEGFYEWGEGHVGKGMLTFDGETSYISIESDESLDLEDQLTFAAWIKLNSSEGRQQVFQRTHYGFGEINSNGGMYSVLHIDDVWNLYPYSQTADEWVDNWHHIATTYDGENVINYLDGVLDTIFTLNGSLPPSEDCLAIGSNCPWLDAKFNGSIDEVRIYNRALSDEEILELTTIVPTGADQILNKPYKLTLSNNIVSSNNSVTQIYYTIPKDEKVSIDILDITGKVVLSLLNNKQKSIGSHSINLDVASLVNGLYFCNLKTEGTSMSLKLIKSE